LGENKCLKYIRKRRLGKRLFGRPKELEKNRRSNYNQCGHRSDTFSRIWH